MYSNKFKQFRNLIQPLYRVVLGAPRQYIMNADMSHIHRVAIVGIYLLSLLVIFLRPLDVQQWQWADDTMYFNNALAIITNLGEASWMGPFTETLLAKPQLYSVFIAFSVGSGIPIRVAEFLIFAPLPFVFLLAVRPLSLPRMPVLYFAMLCLLFIPVAGMELRLLRTTLFGALVLYSLISLTGLLINGVLGRNRSWVWAITAGVAVGLAVSTRSEGIWLFVPSMFVVLVIAFYSWKKIKTLVLLSAFLLMVGYQVPINIFSMLNYKSYGTYSPSLRQSDDYKGLYSLLVSLEPETRQKYVPINEETRYLVYSVSPHFSELQPFLEGPATDMFAKNAGHHFISGWGDKLDQREFFVSIFEWALAKSIFLSGRTSAKEFNVFCRDVRNELLSAIREGRISSGAKGIGLLPPLEVSEYQNVGIASLKSIRLLFEAKGIDRQYHVKINPDLEVAQRWNAYLGAWPGLAEGDKHYTDIIFNKVIVVMFQVFYNVIIVTALFCLVFLIWKDRGKAGIYLSMEIFCIGALMSFSMVMGIVDTVAWPTLNWPKSYNAMGQFPLHYLLLVSMIIIWRSIYEFRYGKVKMT